MYIITFKHLFYNYNNNLQVKMGVPGFFKYLIDNYKNSKFIFNKKEVENIDIINETNNIDYLLIDANCLIHPKCFKVLAENNEITNMDILEEKMISEVMLYINHLISYVNPKSVFLAIDGVAPIAKIKQQRSRRFKSIHDMKLFNNIKLKHKRPLSNFWNNSAITPGTKFMEKLHNKIIEWGKTRKEKIIYSSCNTPSEGEHKLLQFIRANILKNINMNYVLYGLDADLIFLALSSYNISSPIYLLREANQINNKKPEDELNYVSIKIMKECIVKNILEQYDMIMKDEILEHKVNLDSTRLSNDFIFLCYFLGNDFLPHLPSLDIYNDAIDILLQIYAKILINNQQVKQQVGQHFNNYIINVNSMNEVHINMKCFTMLIEELSKMEEDKLKEHFGNKKRARCFTAEPYEKELFRIENLQFKINDPVLLGSDNMTEWRKRYYKHYFGCTTDESIEKTAKNLVKNYIVGLKWVSLYYFDKCPSWEWYFPYEHPPFMCDILNYINTIDINIIEFKEKKPLLPFEQLLCVLPQQSSYLIPKCIQKLMNNHRSSLSHLYPIDFEQDFINKTKYWMGIPMLPPLEIDLVKYIYSKYVKELTKEELFRNRICEEYIFN